MRRGLLASGSSASWPGGVGEPGAEDGAPDLDIFFLALDQLERAGGREFTEKREGVPGERAGLVEDLPGPRAEEHRAPALETG